MNRGMVWFTVGSLVRAGLLPPPHEMTIHSHSITVVLERRFEVDRWTKHIGLPLAREIHDIVHGSVYGVTQFYESDAGWLRARMITVLCVLPEDPMNEEKVDVERVVAAQASG